MIANDNDHPDQLIPVSDSVVNANEISPLISDTSLQMDNEKIDNRTSIHEKLINELDEEIKLQEQAEKQLKSNNQYLHSSINRSQEEDVLSDVLTDEAEELNESYKTDSKPIDEEVLNNLTIGLLDHLMPKFSNAKQSLSNVSENQRILIETIEQENAKFFECQSFNDIVETMQKAKVYHTKLLNIKKDMISLHEKSARLKRRAVKLQQQKEKEALQKELDRERQIERDRLLTAQPVHVKNSSNS